MSRKTAKEALDVMDDKVEKEVKEHLDDMSREVRLSSETERALKTMSDEALKWHPKKRPSACAALQSSEKTVFNYSFKQKLRAGQFPENLHPLVDNWLKELWRKHLDGKIKLPEWHGKCAEVQNISDWLKDIDPKGVITITEARSSFKEVVSQAKQIGDVPNLLHGQYKKACDSCNPLLEYFNIKELKL